MIPGRRQNIALAISFLVAIVLSIAIALVSVAAGFSTRVVAVVAGVAATGLVPLVYRVWMAGKDA